MRTEGEWRDERGTNLVDTGAPFYEVYETADGAFISVGAIEPAFHDELLRRIGIDPMSSSEQMQRERWPATKERFAALFQTKTRDEWCQLLEGTDACFAPVLSLAEAPNHPHNIARGSFVTVAGVPQPAPAPRFARTPAGVPEPPPRPGQHSDEVLADWNFSAAEIAALRREGAVC
jgi:alpha-methylacyl-CoA racemase